LTLSDNRFDLMPEEKKVITVSGKDVLAKELKWAFIGA
jgi:hypothetical protein